MAFCVINMTLENRRDFAAMAMLLHMVLAGIGAALLFCYFVTRNLLEVLHGLLHKHYGGVYVESLLLLGASMILIHGYGVKVRHRACDQKAQLMCVFFNILAMYEFSIGTTLDDLESHLNVISAYVVIPTFNISEIIYDTSSRTEIANKKSDDSFHVIRLSMTLAIFQGH